MPRKAHPLMPWSERTYLPGLSFIKNPPPRPGAHRLAGSTPYHISSAMCALYVSDVPYSLEVDGFFITFAVHSCRARCFITRYNGAQDANADKHQQYGAVCNVSSASFHDSAPLTPPVVLCIFVHRIQGLCVNLFPHSPTNGPKIKIRLMVPSGRVGRYVFITTAATAATASATLRGCKVERVPGTLGAHNEAIPGRDKLIITNTFQPR